MKKIFILAAGAAVACPLPAAANEVIGGFYAHGVDTPFTFDTEESGVDFELGFRGKEIDELSFIGSPAPYVFGSLNTAGDTSFVAAGMAWKAEIGQVYIRPGIGLALHNGPSYRVSAETGQRTDLGSRVLFEPELAVGMDIDDRWSVEASWVHISNARLFNRSQNPGIDMIGLRVNYKM